MDNLLIAKRIKYARKLKEATLEEIANNVGLAKSTVQRYEAGKIDKIKLPVIQSIANYLSVNPAWLIGQSDDMYESRTPSSVPPIIHYYNQLNNTGKEEAEKRVKELTYIPEYSLSAEPNKPILMAAHNEHISEPDEAKNIKSDLEYLKSYQKEAHK